MPLGLVAYASSDEGSDNEEEVQEPVPEKATVKPSNESSNVGVEESNEISDEEDDFINQNSLIEDEDIPGLSSSKSLFSSLPSVSTTVTEPKKESFVDENEDLSTIPKAKTYSENPDLIATKPKKLKGPVRIMAPSLIKKLDDDDEEKVVRPRPTVSNQPSKVKSGLLSLLPAPKGLGSTSSSSTTMIPSSTKSSAPPKPKTSNTMLVPRSVSRKPDQKKKPSKEGDSDDEDVDMPFFTMDAEKNQFKAPLPSASFLTVKSNPEAQHPRGFAPGSHPSHQFLFQEEAEESYGPATAPYPPPAPTGLTLPYFLINNTSLNLTFGSFLAGPSNQDLLANREALERLAGRGNKRRKGEAGLDQIIDVNYEDIKPDEREWMTKALTENDADKPGPKNTIKGNSKRKHQITYLAAMAKEREHELKKEWATSAQNRRASAQKYGF